MRIAIRVDASSELGAGHLYRCLSLSRVLRARGHSVELVAGLDSDFLPGGLDSIDGEIIPVPLNLPEAEDAAFLGAQIGRTDVVIVDRPGFGQEWERIVRSISRRVVAIDDRPGTRHDVDALVSTAAFVDHDQPFTGYVNDSARVLVGPTFMPLRPEFHAKQPTMRTKVARVAAFFGGSDPGGQIEHVLDWASSRASSGLQFRVVAGGLNPRAEEWRQRGASMPNVEVFEQVADVSELWDWADLGIGSYGMAAWERCARALPTISTVQVANQIDDARFLVRAGAVLDIGWASELTTARIENAYSTITSCPWQLESMSMAAMSVMSDQEEDVKTLVSAITSERH